MTIRLSLLGLGVGLVAALTAAPADARPTEIAPAQNLGRIDFPTSERGNAQAHFVRGTLLLHSFMYDDAAEEFEAAQKDDPGFVMAYWGEAMTKNHPLWMQRDAEGAQAVLKRLAPTREARLAKAPTKREHGYLAAVEELYAEGAKKDRDLAYAEAMGRLHEEFPDDLEAQSFYALALLGSCEDRRDPAVYMKAAALAEEVFAKNPMHPGAVHYLIHAYDDPVHAPLGLRAARVYARIAGAAAHALHMPSHIFLALGMWDDVIASNEASWKASDERVARKHLGADERGWHAIFWREYALLQEGRVREARALLDIAESDARGGLQRVVGARSEMRAVYAIETDCDGWTLPKDSADKPRDQFVRGYCAWKKGNRAGIAEALAGLGGTTRAPAADPGAHTHGGAPASYGAPAGSKSESDVYRLELEALEQDAAGDFGRAIATAREAATAESAMSFEFGPPVVVKPAYELLGELLLVARRPAEALTAFEASLARAPGRAASLSGMMRSADRRESRGEVREAEKAWERYHRRADAKASSGKDGLPPLESAGPR